MTALLHRRRRSDDGFTLTEVMVSLVVLSLLAAAAATLMIRSLGLTADARLRASAASLAEREKEVALGSGYDNLPPGTIPARVVSVNGDTFSVTRTVSLAPGTTTANSCTAPDGARLAYKKITVQVTWPDMGSTKPVVNDTVLAVPVGQVNSNLGAVSVPVQDRLTNPLTGVTVTLSNGKQAVSDAFGCAVFTDINPGGYTASVSQAGYIGTNNNQLVTTGLASVVSGRIARTDPIMYDRAATIRSSWSPPSSSYALPLDGQGVLVETAPLTSTSFRAYCTTLTTSGCLPTTAGVATQNPVFPWSGAGYGMSAGRCAPVAGSKIQVAPSPNSTENVSLPVGGVTVGVKRSGSTALSNATVTLVRAADGTCTGGDTLTVYRGSIAARTTITTPVAVPYGTWNVRVSSGTTTVNTATFVVSPTNSQVVAPEASV